MPTVVRHMLVLMATFEIHASFESLEKVIIKIVTVVFIDHLSTFSDNYSLYQRGPTVLYIDVL